MNARLLKRSHPSKRAVDVRLGAFDRSSSRFFQFSELSIWRQMFPSGRRELWNTHVNTFVDLGSLSRDGQEDETGSKVRTFQTSWSYRATFRSVWR